MMGAGGRQRSCSCSGAACTAGPPSPRWWRRSQMHGGLANDTAVCVCYMPASRQDETRHAALRPSRMRAGRYEQLAGSQLACKQQQCRHPCVCSTGTTGKQPVSATAGPAQRCATYIGQGRYKVSWHKGSHLVIHWAGSGGHRGGDHRWQCRVGGEREGSSRWLMGERTERLFLCGDGRVEGLLGG